MPASHRVLFFSKCEVIATDKPLRTRYCEIWAKNSIFILEVVLPIYLYLIEKCHLIGDDGCGSVPA